jgi:hypothetical protein
VDVLQPAVVTPDEYSIAKFIALMMLIERQETLRPPAFDSFFQHGS